MVILQGWLLSSMFK